MMLISISALHLAERHLLIELGHSAYPTVGEIAKRLLLDKSTASRLISKAVGKRYLEYVGEGTDKRKRFLQLTKKGKEVLEAFEEIAYKQTQDALSTLSNEEVETVYKGIALYAKGLKTARLHAKMTVEKVSQQDSIALTRFFRRAFPIDSDQNLLNKYQQDGFSYFILKNDDRIVGGIGFFPQSKNVCELERMYIDPELQDLNFEKQLIEQCLIEANKMGYKQLCAQKNQEFLKNLKECGFMEKPQSELLWKVC